MKKTFLALLAATAAVLAAPNDAAATTLALNISGTFNFGDGIPFSCTVEFDPVTDLIADKSSLNYGAFEAHNFSITLLGGTYTSPDSFQVELLSPGNGLVVNGVDYNDFYGVAISANGGGLSAFSLTATPEFSAMAPTATVFSNYPEFQLPVDIDWNIDDPEFGGLYVNDPAPN